MGIQYKIITNENYEKLAIVLFQFVTSQECIKELDNYPILNDNDCIWIIAKECDKIIAFTGMRVKGTKAILKESYVIPSYRKKGIYSKLFLMREKYIKELNKKTIITGIANKKSAPVFLKNNYTLKRETKNYYYFEKIL